jgi:selenocysteine lyase/cysteine desulfurase
MDPSELAFRLDQEYGILTRVGLHCAPSAHKSLGTFPSGTVRFSFGWATTEEEIGAAAQALGAICG